MARRASRHIDRQEVSTPWTPIRFKRSSPDSRTRRKLGRRVGVPSGLDADKCVETPSIAGVVESVEEQEDDYGGHRLVVIRCADGSRASIRGFGAILGNFFGKVEVGDAIGLEYEGEATPKTQGYSDYPVYRVERIPASPGELKAVPDQRPEAQADDPGAWSEDARAVGS